MSSDQGLQSGALVLASQSAVRARLLISAGLQFERRAAEIDERSVIAKLRTNTEASPTEIAIEVAKAKALAVARPDETVIGADQILVYKEEIFQKATSSAEARARLLSMAGDRHLLATGCVVVRDGVVAAELMDETYVTLRRFDRSFLDWYFQAASPSIFASVACYEIEGLGAQLIDRIDGDFFSALGLPLLPLLASLRRLNVLAR